MPTTLRREALAALLMLSAACSDRPTPTVPTPIERPAAPIGPVPDPATLSGNLGAGAHLPRRRVEILLDARVASRVPLRAV